tara:strand:- start:4490 stop:4846 length:357 start_codon:yes stop_codon:yes gene_type:complete
MSSFITNFRNINYTKRLKESERVTKEHPERCSIIIGKADGATIPDIDKHKFLVPRDITVGQFSHIIRKRIDLSPEIALFLFINNHMPLASSQIGSVYDIHKDVDNFLYITYANENTFG